MTNKEIQLIEKHISSNSVVFEYGSGSSTQWFSRIVLDIDSVEHNKEWFEKVKESLSKNANANIFFVPPVEGWENPVGTDGSYQFFEKYVEFPKTTNKNYTFFLIDGRARVSCCQFITQNYPDAIIAFHDFNNRCNDRIHFYENALQFVDVIETADSLAIMKKKS